MPDTNTTQSLLDQYTTSLNNVNASNTAPINMVTANTGNYLQDQFFQTPGYQLLYGQNANSLDPQQRFQQDPGYQFQLNQGLNQLYAQGASKGLLDSGSTLQNALQYSQGYANQAYNGWLSGQSGVFNNYQNQLAGLVQSGTANNGANAALQTGQAIAGNNTNLAAQSANANLATGQNISSLLNNQGSLGASSYLNTAAAQSNNLLNNASLQAQIDSRNSASQAGSMSSLGSLFGSFGRGNPMTGNGITGGMA